LHGRLVLSYKFSYLFFAMILRIFLTILSIISTPLYSYAQSKEQVAKWLEQFCVESYDSCFDGRLYIEGSLHVDSIVYNETNRYVKAMGTHSYQGRYIPLYGRRLYKVRFDAFLHLSKEKVIIKFRKWFFDLNMSPPYWEECEKTFRLTDNNHQK